MPPITLKFRFGISQLYMFRLAEKRAETMRVALAEGIDGPIDEEDDEEEGSEGEEQVRYHFGK